MTMENSGLKGLNHIYNDCLNIKICECLVYNLTNMSNFQPLEIVDCDSETQPQVVGNLNTLI